MLSRALRHAWLSRTPIAAIPRRINGNYYQKNFTKNFDVKKNELLNPVLVSDRYLIVFKELDHLFRTQAELSTHVVNCSFERVFINVSVNQNDFIETLKAAEFISC